MSMAGFFFKQLKVLLRVPFSLNVKKRILQAQELVGRHDLRLLREREPLLSCLCELLAEVIKVSRIDRLGDALVWNETPGKISLNKAVGAPSAKGGANRSL